PAALTTAPPDTAIAPSAPSFTTAVQSSPASHRGAASTSAAPVTRTASSGLGRTMSVAASAAANPPSHAPDGSQFGSTLVVAPLSRAGRDNPGRSAGAPG